MLSTLDAAWHYKSQTENCCRVLFMMCWHKFQMIFQQSLYCVQCRQTLAVARGVSGVDTVLLTYREETKQPRHPIANLPLLEFSPALESWFDIYTGPTSCLIVPQTFSFFICHLYLSVARLMSVRCTEPSSTSWVDTPLTADWLHVCFGTQPWLSFLKRFWKMTYTTFKIKRLAKRGNICSMRTDNAWSPPPPPTHTHT